MTGDAPVPVPPPIPAAMKIILADEVSSRLRSTGSLSNAASRPLAASLPAPRPSRPRRILHSTGELSIARWSVLQTTKLTPVMPMSYMWFTALPPAPPTPATSIIELGSRAICDTLSPAMAFIRSSVSFVSLFLLLSISSSVFTNFFCRNRRPCRVETTSAPHRDSRTNLLCRQCPWLCA